MKAQLCTQPNMDTIQLAAGPSINISSCQQYAIKGVSIWHKGNTTFVLMDAYSALHARIAFFVDKQLDQVLNPDKVVLLYKWPDLPEPAAA